VGTNQRRKPNFIKDLLVKIARREHLEILEGDTTPFSIYASAWLERKKAILARSTYGDYRSIWKKYVLPNFGNIPLCRVTRLDVEEFLGNLPDISAKRKNNIMVRIRSGWRVCWDTPAWTWSLPITGSSYGTVPGRTVEGFLRDLRRQRRPPR
jgi:integrase-like protein